MGHARWPALEVRPPEEDDYLANQNVAGHSTRDQVLSRVDLRQALLGVPAVLLPSGVQNRPLEGDLCRKNKNSTPPHHACVNFRVYAKAMKCFRFSHVS